MQVSIWRKRRLSAVCNVRLAAYWPCLLSQPFVACSEETLTATSELCLVFRALPTDLYKLGHSEQVLHVKHVRKIMYTVCFGTVAACVRADYSTSIIQSNVCVRALKGQALPRASHSGESMR